MNPLAFILLRLAGWMNQNQQDVIEYLQEEIRVLKELLGKKPRFNDDQRRCLAGTGKRLGRKTLDRFGSLVTPGAQKYDSSKTRQPRRLRTEAEIQERILKFARESGTWRYTRIQGALVKLRHDISRRTIANILKTTGIEPALMRRNGMTWRDFLKAHWEVLDATDLFTVEVRPGRGPVRFDLLFVIQLATRVVEIAGVVPEPTESRMLQIARNLVDPWTGFLTSSRRLILNRATVLIEYFR